jgi:hypothetical protein
MSPTVQDVYNNVIQALPPTERLRLATLILNGLVQQDSPTSDSPQERLFQQSDCWTEQDQTDVVSFSLQYAASLFADEETV